MACKTFLITLIFSFSAAQAQAQSTAYALRLARESLELAGLDVSDSLVKLQRLLRQEYGIQTQCAPGWVLGLSEIRCLKATRTLARALYQELLPSLTEPRSSSLLIEFTDGKTVQEFATLETVTWRIPWRTSMTDIAAFVTSALASDHLGRLAFIHGRFLDALKQIDANFPQTVTFAEDLDPSERWQALTSLLALAKTNMKIFDRPSEELHIARAFLPPGEAHQSLRETLAFHASTEHIADHLRRFEADVRALAHEIHEQRLKVQSLQNQLLSRFRMQAACSAQSRLTLKNCASTLARWEKHLDREPRLQPWIRHVEVMAAGESSTRVQSRDDGTLILREDFDTVSLTSLALWKGWVSAW